MFDDDEFRGMCKVFYEAGGNRDTVPCLRRHALLKYVNAEFESDVEMGVVDLDSDSHSD